MKTLLIYDTTGRIIFQGSGSVQEPEGIPFIWVEVPSGKYVTGIDVTGKSPVAIFADYPKSESAILSDQITAINIALAEMMGV